MTKCITASENKMRQGFITQSETAQGVNYIGGPTSLLLIVGTLGGIRAFRASTCIAIIVPAGITEEFLFNH